MTGKDKEEVLYDIIESRPRRRRADKRRGRYPARTRPHLQLGSRQSDSTAFLLSLDTYATRLLARPLNGGGEDVPVPLLKGWLLFALAAHPPVLGIRSAGVSAGSAVGQVVTLNSIPGVKLVAGSLPVVAVLAFTARQGVPTVAA